MTKDVLLREFNTLPENLQAQVLDFILFLKNSKLVNREKPNPSNGKTLKAGFGKYSINIKPDFDEPLEDFKEYTS